MKTIALSSLLLLSSALIAPAALAQGTAPAPSSAPSASPSQTANPADAAQEEEVEISTPGAEATDAPTDAAEIVVTGSRTPNIVRRTPQVVSVLSSADITSGDITRHGHADDVAGINRAGVEIARAAFGGREGWVLGDIGPFGGLMEPYGDFTEAEVRRAFAEQARALVDAGAGPLAQARQCGPQRRRQPRRRGGESRDHAAWAGANRANSCTMKVMCSWVSGSCR